jgi:hypothetical protein
MCRDLAWCSQGKDPDEAMLHDQDQYIARNAVNYANYLPSEDPKEETAQVLNIQLERAGPKSLGQLGGVISQFAG